MTAPKGTEYMPPNFIQIDSPKRDGMTHEETGY